MIIIKPLKISNLIKITNRFIHTPKQFEQLNATLSQTVLPQSPSSSNVLHSRKSLEFLLNQNYKHLSINFNKRVKDSKLEPLKLTEVLLITSKFDNFNLLYNISSELLGLEWYLNYLTNNINNTDSLLKAGIKSELLDNLKIQFGGLDALSNQIIERQKLLSGKGWIWLVLHNNNYLKLISSPNHEFPLYPPKSSKKGSLEELKNIQLLFPFPTWEYYYILDYKFEYEIYLRNLISNLNWKELDKLIVSINK